MSAGGGPAARRRAWRHRRAANRCRHTVGRRCRGGRSGARPLGGAAPVRNLGSVLPWRRWLALRSLCPRLEWLARHGCRPGCQRSAGKGGPRVDQDWRGGVLASRWVPAVGRWPEEARTVGRSAEVAAAGSEEHVRASGAPWSLGVAASARALAGGPEITGGPEISGDQLGQERRQVEVSDRPVLGSALSFSEVKALATGNPLLMDKAEADATVARPAPEGNARSRDSGMEGLRTRVVLPGSLGGFPLVTTD